jgi:hypothetical protein
MNRIFFVAFLALSFALPTQAQTKQEEWRLLGVVTAMRFDGGVNSFESSPFASKALCYSAKARLSNQEYFTMWVDCFRFR